MSTACARAQTNRVTLRNSLSSEETTLMLSKEQEADASLYKDKESGAELEVTERMPVLEWLANNYKKFGCQLEFITNKSQACAPGVAAGSTLGCALHLRLLHASPMGAHACCS